jgi:hypothetical protein
MQRRTYRPARPRYAESVHSNNLSPSHEPSSLTRAYCYGDEDNNKDKDKDDEDHENYDGDDGYSHVDDDDAPNVVMGFTSEV